MSEACCVRVRIEGKSAHQIHEAAKAMNLVIKRVWKKEHQATGYGYYGYGNSRNTFPAATPSAEQERGDG